MLLICAVNDQLRILGTYLKKSFCMSTCLDWTLTGPGHFKKIIMKKIITTKCTRLINYSQKLWKIV